MGILRGVLSDEVGRRTRRRVNGRETRFKYFPMLRPTGRYHNGNGQDGKRRGPRPIGIFRERSCIDPPEMGNATKFDRLLSSFCVPVFSAYRYPFTTLRLHHPIPDRAQVKHVLSRAWQVVTSSPPCQPPQYPLRSSAPRDTRTKHKYGKHVPSCRPLQPSGGHVDRRDRSVFSSPPPRQPPQYPLYRNERRRREEREKARRATSTWL